MKLAASPIRDRAYGCCRRESPVLLLVLEVDLHRNQTAAVNMHVAMSSNPEIMECSASLGGLVFIRAILGLGRFLSCLFAFSNENKRIRIILAQSTGANQDIAQHLITSTIYNLRLIVGAVDEKFDFLRFHNFTFHHLMGLAFERIKCHTALSMETTNTYMMHLERPLNGNHLKTMVVHTDNILPARLVAVKEAPCRAQP